MDGNRYPDKRKKNENKQRMRLVLMLVLIVALVYVVPRFLHTDGPDQTVPEPPAQLTLLTAPHEETAAPQAPAEPAPTPEATEEPLPTESGSYTEVEDVAYYLHTYGHLPDNYMTKSEAEDAGWRSYAGNLWDVAYGMSIGGDRYGNYDGQLPKGERYYEADVNYDGGYRGGERVVYTEDGDVWYTSDHYESFERLY